MAYKHKRLTQGTLTTVLAGRLYTADEAAVYLNVAAQTLAHWRVQGIGPKFIHYRSAAFAIPSWLFGTG